MGRSKSTSVRPNEEPVYCMRDVIRAYPQSHVPTVCAPRAARVKTHHNPAATAATTATAMPTAGNGKSSRRAGS